MLDHAPTRSFQSTALIVGAGAVENSWTPVCRALNRHSEVPIDLDNANLFLTRTVYRMRYFSRRSDPPDSPYADQDFRATFRAIKQSIAEELLAAEESGELRLKNAMPFILDRLISPKTDGFMFITTNWDRVAERQTEKLLNETQPARVAPVHIHGSIDDHEGLYLPSEVADECYRTEAHNQRLGGRHLGLMDALESVRNLVLYGLSLSPLDAELAQFMASGLRADVLEDIKIVAPDHQAIASRLRMLLRDPSVQISGLDPTALQ